MKPVSIIIEINFHVETSPDDTSPYVDAARAALCAMTTRYDIDEWEYNSTDYFDTILTVQFQRDFLTQIGWMFQNGTHPILFIHDLLTLIIRVNAPPTALTVS